MTFRRPEIEYLEGEEILASNAAKKSVERYAENVARIAEFGIGEDPAELTAQLGGSIHYEDMDELVNENGSIFVHGERDFDILLPTYTSPRRDRFTIAHELGHYFLHSSQGEKPIVAYRQGSTRIEWEANWFAAALLMPEDEFKKACRKASSIAVIAGKFGVSEDAAAVRRKAIGA